MTVTRPVARRSPRVVATGLENPCEVTWGPDGHLWATERRGFRVTGIDPSTGAKQMALMLDDTTRVSCRTA